MPPEWYPHESTWLAWPKNQLTWPTFLAEVQETFLELIVTLSLNEKVDLLVDNQAVENRIRRRLAARGHFSFNVCFRRIPTADCWIRDYGPNFLVKPLGEEFDLALNQWNFNAWGSRYPDLQRDAGVTPQLASRLGLRPFLPQLILEGGAIEVNGEGDCLASEPCLLNPNRNPEVSRSDIELRLQNHLGVRNIIWMGEGIAGDDTDAHVDQIARFVGPNTIVCSRENDPTDPNHHPLRDNWMRLRMARNGRGQPFDLVPLPMPAPIATAQTRLPASYANFYIANGIVVYPRFGVPQDGQAKEILRKLFPTRRLVGMDSRKLVMGKGALHCMTQQQPSVSRPTSRISARRHGSARGKTR